MACLVLGVILLLTGEWTASWPCASDWAWLLLLGLVATSLAFAITVEVMRVLSPFTVAMAINLEPVYAILLALVIFGQEEVMPPGFYGGAAARDAGCDLNTSITFDRVANDNALRSFSP